MNGARHPISDQSHLSSDLGEPEARAGNEAHQRTQSEQSEWLSVEQIRKRERMRRTRVILAMESGDLPYEQRGRIRYARLCDVVRWQEQRLRQTHSAPVQLRSDLRDLA